MKQPITTLMSTAIVLGALPTTILAQPSTRAVEPFAVSRVRLTDSEFKHAQSMDMCYLLGLNANRLLAPYLKEAGLAPKAENYTNWENTGLDGHIGGHYLSALAYMYAATGDMQIKERLDYTLGELKRCQDAVGTGYLSGVPNGRVVWQEIKEGNIRASGFGLNDRWVPLYNIHKIYAGLRDAYLQAGSQEAKQMLIGLTDWMLDLVSDLTDEQIEDMLRSEHGGLNETFADVAAITGDKRYLRLARQFSHQSLLQPLLSGQDCLTGMHANTQIPKVIGFKRIADIDNDKDWDKAVAYFWEKVVSERSITIGGNSVREHFHPSDDFSSMLSSEQGPESCNTYNMLRLTKMLYESSGNVAYLDYYERALYNHILSTINPVQGGFVYFTPMRAGHYRVYSQPQTSFWCCVGSGIENHARYGEMIYSHRDKNLYVNLFIPSTLDWSEQNVKIEQQNHFPDVAETTLTVTPNQSAEFTLHLRCPEWTSADKIQITVNETPVAVDIADGYVVLKRKWAKGDHVRMQMPMSLRAETTPDGAPHYSILYGPIVLAAKIGVQEQTGLFADDSRGGHIASGRQLPINQMPVIVGDKETILEHIKMKSQNPMSFTLQGVSPSQYEGLELVPFYRLHECRYMVYFPLVSQSELQHRQEQEAQREREVQQLNLATVDRVVCGEQQPESDHFVEMSGAVAGQDNGVHWREASDWFSYRMRSNKVKATHLYIVCQADAQRDFSVSINGVAVANIRSDREIIKVELPLEIEKDEFLVVKFGRLNSRVTSRICEVRLLCN